MPHDANGKLLNVGDTVNVRCNVKEIHQTEEFCNLTLETNLPMFPTRNLTTVVLNAKQVFKVEAGFDEIARRSFPTDVTHPAPTQQLGQKGIEL